MATVPDIPHASDPDPALSSVPVYHFGRSEVETDNVVPRVSQSENEHQTAVSTISSTTSQPLISQDNNLITDEEYDQSPVSSHVSYHSAQSVSEEYYDSLSESWIDHVSQVWSTPDNAPSDGFYYHPDYDADHASSESVEFIGENESLLGRLLDFGSTSEHESIADYDGDNDPSEVHTDYSEEEIVSDTGEGNEHEIVGSSDEAERDLPPDDPPLQDPVLPNLAVAAIERLRANRDSEDDDDFIPAKRRKKQHSPDNGDHDDDNDKNDEDQACSICFEPWTNSGTHRIASLKCGHLFGYNCIEKWLRGSSDGRCPQCNLKAKKSDIRVIYAKSISVVDTTGRDRALQELEEERRIRIQAQKSEAQTIIQYQLAKSECERVKQKLEKVKETLQYYENERGPSQGCTADKETPPSPAVCSKSVAGDEGQFASFKTITISQTPACRVMAYDKSRGMLVVSKQSNNRLIPGCGLMKVSMLSYKASEFVGVHDKCIRDVVFSPRGDGLTLSAGMDKTLRLTSMYSNTVVLSYNLPVPSWACCWNEDDPNYVYCGLCNGQVMTFDLRQTADPVHQLQRLEGRCGLPVTSLAYVPLCRGASLNCGGILTGALDGVVFWEATNNAYTPHHIHSLSGSCTSVSFDPITRHSLLSFRPSKNATQSRHMVCHLKNTPYGSPLTCNLVHQFNGGPVHQLLSRSLLFNKPQSDGKLLVAYGNEALRSTLLWDVGSAAKLQHIPTDGQQCLDIKVIKNDDAPPIMALLTDTKVYLNRWRSLS